MTFKTANNFYVSAHRFIIFNYANDDLIVKLVQQFLALITTFNVQDFSLITTLIMMAWLCHFKSFKISLLVLHVLPLCCKGLIT
jgi:hypothetical protein